RAGDTYEKCQAEQLKKFGEEMYFCLVVKSFCAKPDTPTSEKPQCKTFSYEDCVQRASYDVHLHMAICKANYDYDLDQCKKPPSPPPTPPPASCRPKTKRPKTSALAAQNPSGLVEPNQDPIVTQISQIFDRILALTSPYSISP